MLIFEIPIIGILAILSVMLLTGRGAFLVAGYNTSGKARQERYDQKKLSRTAGVMLSVVTVATALDLSGFLSGTTGGIAATVIYTVVLLGSVAVGMVYMNTKCLKKVPQNGAAVGMDAVAQAPELLKEKRRQFIVLLVPFAVAIVVFGAIIASMVASEHPTVYTIGNGTLNINTMFGETVRLSSIQKLELKGMMPPNLEKTNGLGLGTILKGQFSASGEAMNVYVDTAAPPFLYLHTANGLVIVNGQNKAKTQALYQTLRAATRR